MSDQMDPAELGASWTRQWHDHRPIGHELRDISTDQWIRFHSLPESKRYAETEAERNEILLRHNTAIDELVADTGDSNTTILVATCAHSDSAEPVPRSEDVHTTSPHAIYWQAILLEQDEDEEYWTHLYVEAVAWRHGVLDDLLSLVAEWQAVDVFVAPIGFEWLYHPYDGGADIVATNPEQRNQMRDAHLNWLSAHPKQL